MNATWRTYEEVATAILNEVAVYLGLERVEGPQPLTGLRTGTTWNVEAKGVRAGGEGFVIVECRRYTTSKLKQEALGGLAYRIHDTGAAGGIVVSPLGLQEGATLVAAAENIVSVHLASDSTPQQFVVEVLDHVIVRPQGLQVNTYAGEVTVVAQDNTASPDRAT